MKYIFSFLLLCLFIIGCGREEKAIKETEDLERFAPEHKTDLSNFEYVCDHCKIGSHKPGNCPCGMEYEKNTGFEKIVETN